MRSQHNSLVLIFFILFNMSHYSVLGENNIKSEENNLLTKICLLNFNAQMKSLGKVPSPEIADFTCKCFLNKIKNGSSIESAKDYCKKEASVKFTF